MSRERDCYSREKAACCSGSSFFPHIYSDRGSYCLLLIRGVPGTRFGSSHGCFGKIADCWRDFAFQHATATAIWIWSPCLRAACVDCLDFFRLWPFGPKEANRIVTKPKKNSKWPGSFWGGMASTWELVRIGAAWQGPESFWGFLSLSSRVECSEQWLIFDFGTRHNDIVTWSIELGPFLGRDRFAAWSMHKACGMVESGRMCLLNGRLVDTAMLMKDC